MKKTPVFDIKQQITEEIRKICPQMKDALLHPVLSHSLTVEDNRPVIGYGCLSEDTLYFFEDGALRDAYPMSSLSDFKVQVGIGQAALECRRDGKLLILCRGDLSHKEEYAVIARHLNRYKETGVIPDDYDVSYHHICETCGRRILPGAGICPHCVDKTKMLRRIWEIAGPYRKTILFSIFLFIVITGLNLLTPLLNRIMVDEYIKPQNPDVRFFGVILSLFVLSIVTRLTGILRSHALIGAGNKIIVRLREMVFDRVQLLSVSRISKRTAGDIMQRVTGDTEEIKNFVVNNLSNMIEQSLILIGVSVMLIMTDPLLALMILLPIPLCAAGFRLFWNYCNRIYHKQWITNTRAGTILHDIFSGIRVVKSFGREHHEMERYDEVTKKEAEISVKSERLYSVFSPTFRFFMCVGEFFLLYYVGNAILSDKMTLGEMAQFSAYVGMLYSGPVFLISNIQRQLTRVFTSMAKVFDLLDEDVEIEDKQNAQSIRIKGQITFENVHFGYDNAEDVLKGIDLTVEPGEFIGIVGRSGVGKSTLINLVMRLYDVNEGRILIDGVDVRDLSQDCLRSRIGVVLQETFLFSGTVYDNIAYAKPSATRDEIIAAAKLSGAHSFIMKLPDAYNTKVGEKGHTLSGGERQRISIARALLHDPRILILDEATASLDTETEKQIQDALQKLSHDRTTLAIAHRLSTLRNATRLIVLDKGKIAEVGTHDELIRMKGIYYGLVMAQRQMSKMTHDT